jgi:hypothetical protein
MNSAFDLQADLQQMRLWTQVAQAARQGRAR